MLSWVLRESTNFFLGCAKAEHEYGIQAPPDMQKRATYMAHGYGNHLTVAEISGTNLP